MARQLSMRRILALTLVVAGFGAFAAGQAAPHVAASSHHAAVISIDGAIDPISARFLFRSISSATEDGAQFLLVLLDTPGGRLDSTFDMVEDLLGADIPVVVYVSPAGAIAASAGTFITAAAHVAAMAPGTSVGAASPVGPTGGDLPDTLKNKATQAAMASLRSIAEERGRNQKALEDTVQKATSYSATEALNAGIIDLLARDIDDLLAELDGRAVEVNGNETVLATQGIELRMISRTPVERFLGFLADPNVAFLMLTIGGIGILIELLNPGMLTPGIAGVIALVLAFVSVGNLPVNWTGVGLMGFAMLLFFLELQAPGIGVFGVGGAVAFVLGSFLLIGEVSPPSISAPSFKVSIWVVAGTSGVLFVMMGGMFRAALQAKGASYTSPQESLVGQEGTATTRLDPHGTVQIASELWSAVSETGEPISEGEHVVVLGLEGLTVKVARPEKRREQEAEE